MTDYDAGVALLRRLGATDRPAVLDLFAAVGAEDFGAEAVAFVYGGVYQRPQLSLRRRQLVTVAVLATLGYAQAQLDFHRAAALEVGCTQEEIDAAESSMDDPLLRLAVLIARGGLAPELVEVARRLDRQEAVEVILHTAIYAGFPAALNALTMLARAD
ncbi:hypothetical protein Lesp02_71970 [Lentzea sp. NBRC 105346]|uniref:carboxymuconolactone decarboxylase family protein n=1 Tax=Lentzea sp. NBRC 105346 TaxID=3032205 RepID=UPI0024A609B5|nr:carboxymuconolactone decarboxylase family protein [Lentzea sp. NBRC 105346]GLZ35010.1 hypothetical protein Lesp02_71970 [Lentzea sp. NBRC 105346]